MDASFTPHAGDGACNLGMCALTGNGTISSWFIDQLSTTEPRRQGTRMYIKVSYLDFAVENGIPLTLKNIFLKYSINIWLHSLGKRFKQYRDTDQTVKIWTHPLTSSLSPVYLLLVSLKKPTGSQWMESHGRVTSCSILWNTTKNFKFLNSFESCIAYCLQILRWYPVKKEKKSLKEGDGWGVYNILTDL